MDELPTYSMKRFRGALGDALRARRGNDMGDVKKTVFYKEVAEKGGWAETTVGAYVTGARAITRDVLQVMAEILEVEPTYFLEWRLWEIEEAYRLHPALAQRIYESLMLEVATLDEHAAAGVAARARRRVKRESVRIP